VAVQAEHDLLAPAGLDAGAAGEQLLGDVGAKQRACGDGPEIRPAGLALNGLGGEAVQDDEDVVVPLRVGVAGRGVGPFVLVGIAAFGPFADEPARQRCAAPGAAGRRKSSRAGRYRCRRSTGRHPSDGRDE